jgi:hypothetical protein
MCAVQKKVVQQACKLQIELLKQWKEQAISPMLLGVVSSES